MLPDIPWGAEDRREAGEGELGVGGTERGACVDRGENLRLLVGAGVGTGRVELCGRERSEGNRVRVMRRVCECALGMLARWQMRLLVGVYLRW